MKFDYQDQVENNSELIQPIPILTLTNKERSKFLVLKNINLVKDSPEKNKLLIYLGGHIRREDSINKEKDFLAIASQTLSRKIQEELDFLLSPALENPLCIWCKENKGGEHHIALLSIHEVAFDFIDLELDYSEYIPKKGTLKSKQVLNLKELEMEYENLEDWSKIILKEVLNINIANQTDLFKKT